MKNICIWEATVYVIHTHNIDRSFGGCDVFNCSFPAFIDLNDFSLPCKSIKIYKEYKKL